LHTFDVEPPSLLQRLKDFFSKNEPLRWEKGCARSLRNLLYRLHQEKKIDVVEIPDYGGLAYQFGGSPPFPIVINFHMPTELVDSLNKVSLSKCHKKWHCFEEHSIKRGIAFRSPSEALKKYACARYRLAPARVSVIRNPVSCELFEIIRKNSPSIDERIDLLFAGRLEFRKGIDIIAQNIGNILNLDRKITITFAGQTEIAHAPDYRIRIENSLSHEDRKRVWFIGAVNRSQIAVLYCRSHILLLPSLFENAPYVLLEAMASKLPVIGAAAGGITEIIRHGKNGLLFDPDQPESFVQGIQKFILNPSRAKECAEQAFQDIQTFHAPEKIAVESISLYESLR
jgi:glycogen(starch) synthase